MARTMKQVEPNPQTLHKQPQKPRSDQGQEGKDHFVQCFRARGGRQGEKRQREMETDRQTLEHTALNTFFPSNFSPQSSGNLSENEAGRVREAERREYRETADQSS